MSVPGLTVDDRDDLLDVPGWMILFGDCSVQASPEADGDDRQFWFFGPRGNHSVLVGATGAGRLNAYWRRFCSDQLDLPVSAGVRS